MVFSDPKAKPAILASRGSTLALWQANFVAHLLNEKQCTVEIKTWKTTGDIVQNRFLHEIGGKGLFIRELEDAMAKGQADFAVHSLKDLPVKIPEAFVLAAVLKRHIASDVIIFKRDVGEKISLLKGSIINAEILRSIGPMTVATSSLRRQALLTGNCPDIAVVPIRGNVDTRIKKLEHENFHALILAEASLERLQIKNLFAFRLDPNWFVPCAGQGALAIEAPKVHGIISYLKQLECSTTRRAVNIERRVLAGLGGDCTMPFGCHVSEDPRGPNQILARTVLLTTDGLAVKSVKTFAINAEKNDSDIEREFAAVILDDLKKQGANDVLRQLGIEVRI